ncbi:acyl-CoA dehydratase activase [Dehalobacter sp. DCM]|uniref:acyl-CoA dehydratase activase n=1 Tax=Dehalobacter sp. DCM TaxID=2907827 RepID=UPI0030816326|nr:acyl-CoA dehydratase activase [Dehalobacter sp. DCM]
MLVAGVDVGAATAKTAIVKDGHFIAFAVMPTGDIVTKAAEDVTIKALKKAGYSMKDLDYVVSTGYARHHVKFTDKAVTEIICHARGANYMMPQVRTIIDIGGQDSKVIHVNEVGRVVDFVMNDKCAAGTGRFLEVMAQVLNTTIDQMGPLSLKAKNVPDITSTCTIFAETELISLRAEMTPREDMIAGLHRAVARRVVLMGQVVGYREQVAFTGGVAMNQGIKFFLEETLKMPIVVPEQPQIMGALGAALLATETRVGKVYERSRAALNG